MISNGAALAAGSRLNAMVVLRYAVELILLAGVLLAPGYLLLRMCPRFRLGAVPIVLTSFALGAACWCAIIFLLCAAGWFRGPVVYAIALALGAADLVAVLPAVRSRWRDLKLTQRRFRFENSLLSGAITVAAATLFLLCLIPTLAWDSDAYHLTVPKIYAAHSGFRPIAFNVYSNWPLNIELLFGLALQLSDHVAAKLVHFLFGLALLAAVHQFAKRRRDAFTGLLAAMLLLANPVVLFEFFVAYVDLAMAFFLFMSFWCLTCYAEQPQGRRTLLVLAGVFAGVVCGIKLTGVVAAACVALLLLFARRPCGDGKPSRAALWACFALPCLALAAPWWVKSWYYTGNPTYPFFFGVFGGPDWSGELATQFRAWHQSIGMGRGWLDYMLLPVRVILEGREGYDRFDGGVNRLWIVWLPIALLGMRTDKLVRRSLLVVGTYFVFWAATSQQMRFLIPMMPVLSVAAAAAVRDLIGRLRTERSRRLLAGLASLATVVSLITCSARGLRASVAVADAHRQASTPGVGHAAIRPVFEFINRELPPDARLVFFNDNRGFFCGREYIADSFFEASQLGAMLRPTRTAREVRGLIDELGATHVLWHDKDWGIEYPAAMLEMLADRRQVELVYESPDGSDVVYALK